MVKNESCGTWASIPATISPMFISVAASCRNESPIKRNEKPKMNSPMLLRLPLPLNINGIPIASKGMAKAAMFTLKPTAEIIQAVTVVPMLAPIITPILCTSVINPAFTKLTTITVVALDDWMRAVIRIPVSTPITRFFVIAANMLRRRSPANFSRPSDIVFIPKRNNASEPTSEKMLIINSIFLNFAAKILQSYYAVVTLMLQFCYKRRCNLSITRMKCFCNKLSLPLQCQSLTVG